MSDETTVPTGDIADDPVPVVASPSPAASDGAAPEVGVRTPEFVPLQDGGAAPEGPIDRFFDVDVTVWAELGRVTMSLGELMKLGANAVIKLGRPVSAPVELMAQGVRFATGEVVVVDDCFAVRIQEIEGVRRSD